MDKGEAWWEFLSEGQKDLVGQAYALLDEFKAQGAKFKTSEFHDYSFIVFPMAKAYEGMLKLWFFKLGLISRKTYEGDRFRVGKALNPDLPVRLRGKWWMYGPVAEQCGDELPLQLWRAWRECRNRLFHFFPKHQQFISLEEADRKVKQLEEAMRAAVECRI